LYNKTVRQSIAKRRTHHAQRPGNSTVKALAGLHAMAAWDQPIITETAGFQAYALIRQNPAADRIT
ncbi:MAG: hypothetical protein HXY37_07825, partial [Chloroflexi bacterium]|nr:hypothetical protein [Chloroflexota bacterium]